MVNKKGYLKTIEAVIAILIILGFIYIITPKQHLPEETTPQSVASAEEFIINQILYNSTYRSCIVSDNRPCIDNLVKKNSPSGYNYQFEMCDTSTSCLQELNITLPIDKSIYSKSILVSQEKGLISPKVFRVYMWEGKVESIVSCVNDCTTTGLKQCYTTTSYQICGQYDADACLDWNIVNCNAGQTCSNGDCINQCVPKTCSDLGKTCGSWDNGCNGTVNCGGACPSNISLSRQVSTTANDGWIVVWDADVLYEGFTTTYHTALAGLYAPDSWWGPYSSFFRFTNISIPKGAVILSANFQGYAAEQIGTACYTRIYAEAADNSTAPTSYADYIGRTMSTNSLHWDFLNNTFSGWFPSPSIKNIIQETVNRAGWSSGNAITIFWKDDGSGGTNRRAFYDYSGSSSYAAKLNIVWTSR